MAQYGARYVSSRNANQEQVLHPFVVTSGVTVTQFDFVYFASGKVTNATIAGARPAGVVQSTVVGDGTKTVLVDVTPNAIYAIDNDNVGTTFVATHVGQYFALTGATGAQLVDTSTVSASAGELVCVGFGDQAPYRTGDTDNSVGLFEIAKSAYKL